MSAQGVIFTGPEGIDRNPVPLHTVQFTYILGLYP